MWPVRYTIALLCCLANVICYIDRAKIGVAILRWELSADIEGYLLAAFFIGYGITQMPGAHWAHRHGGKRVLMWALLTWTVFDVVTMLFALLLDRAHSLALVLIVVARIGLGLGEGANMPTLHTLLARWFPLAERTKAVTFVNSGQDVGIIISLLVSPLIAEHWHWSFLFIVFAVLSVLWMALFAKLGAR